MLQAMTLEEFNHGLARFPFAYFEDKPHSLSVSSLTKGIFGQTGNLNLQLTVYIHNSCIHDGESMQFLHTCMQNPFFIYN
jgi:hypothetical protein